MIATPPPSPPPRAPLPFTIILAAAAAAVLSWVEGREPPECLKGRKRRDAPAPPSFLPSPFSSGDVTFACPTHDFLPLPLHPIPLKVTFLIICAASLSYRPHPLRPPSAEAPRGLSPEIPVLLLQGCLFKSVHFSYYFSCTCAGSQKSAKHTKLFFGVHESHFR